MCLPIFVLGTKMFFSYNFGAPLKYEEVRSDIEIWLINKLFKRKNFKYARSIH